MRCLCVVVLIACMFYACKDAKDDAASSGLTGASYYLLEGDTVLHSSCDKLDECTRIVYQYPVFYRKDSTAYETLNKAINDYTVGLLSEQMSEDNLMPLSEIKTNFFSSYSEYVSAADETSPWYIEVDAVPNKIKDFLYNITFKSGAYAGGAHENSYLSYRVVNLENESLKELRDFVIDMPSLTRIGEQYFRKTEKLQSNSSLEGEGYFFENGVYALPSEMGRDEYYLLLFYNTYEIEPYASGTTLIRIPYSEVEKYIKL